MIDSRNCQTLGASPAKPGGLPLTLELRDFVLWRKQSFGSQSERGDRFAERVMSVVRTARKQGKAVLDFMVATIGAYVHGTTPPRLLGADATA